MVEFAPLRRQLIRLYLPKLKRSASRIKVVEGKIMAKEDPNEDDYSDDNDMLD